MTKQEWFDVNDRYRNALEKLLRAAREAGVPQGTNPGGWVSAVYVSDVAAAALAGVEMKEADDG